MRILSLDRLREELEVDPEEGQGEVVAAAREQAREHLRRSERFAWNATNLSQQLRAKVIDLLASYNARVKIVAVEVKPERLFAQNRSRDRPVPEAIIERLLARWEAPDLTEAHGVERVGWAEPA